MRLSARTGQPDAVDDLEFFLKLPESRLKEPCAVLFPETEDCDGEVGAAVLLFQYRLFGVASRVYSSADMTGRRTVIAPATERMRVAAAAVRLLLERGGQICLLTVNGTAAHGEAGSLQAQAGAVMKGLAGARWSLHGRDVPLYLRLEATTDKTLAGIGQRTRSNLRYYRRRSERDLGCVFVPDAQISDEEFLRFSKLCKYAVPDELAKWRLQSLGLIQRPFLHGLRNRDGEWLAVVAGRRLSNGVEIDWQCNRADLPEYSLSTVVRAYLIEHEVGLGSRRLYIEGGTPNPIQHSFATEQASDLVVVRRTLYTRAIRRLAPQRRFPKNHVSQAIADPALTWHTA